MFKIAVLIVCMCSYFLYAQTEDYKVAILNSSNPSTIQKYKKVEIGIDLGDGIEGRIKEFLEPGSFSGLAPLNPFLSWELDIKAVFSHAASGTVKNRDFFYYHDYEQVGNTWDDAVNDRNEYLMRARFAPPEAGEWKAHVIITLDGDTIKLPAFTFIVQDNNHPGFVKVHPNKRNFLLGDSIVFPLGHVFPGPYNRAAGGKTPWGDPPNNEPNRNTTVGDWNAHLGDIESYIKQGGKSIKLIQTSYGNLIEFEEKGNYYKRMHYAWEQDKILDLCEENGVLINFNLLFQDVIMGYGQNGSVKEKDAEGNPTEFWGDPWDYGNYGGNVKSNPNDYFPAYCYFVPGKLPSHMFLTPELMDYHKQRTRYYVARYGYSPQIYAWELMSEILHMDEFHYGTLDTIDPATNRPMEDKPAQISSHPGHQVATDAINTYHNEISAYIKNELGDADHLIAMDIAPISPDQIDQYVLESSFNPAIDIIGFNFYSNRPDKLIIGKRDKNGKNNLDIENDSSKKETSEYVRIHEQSVSYQKPIILSEMGHNSGTFKSDCFMETGNVIDATTYGFCGVAGMHPWDGYVYDNNNSYDQRQLWSSTIVAAKHMNSKNVVKTLAHNQGEWKQGRQVEKVHRSDEEYAKELQYYLSEDRSAATGYIRNRSYNVHTMRTNENCFATTDLHGFDVPLNNFYPFSHEQGDRFFNDNQLYVTGLEKKAWYSIVWFDALTGLPIEPTQVQQSDRNLRLELQFPDLTLENPLRPIVWFSIQKLDN